MTTATVSPGRRPHRRPGRAAPLLVFTLPIMLIALAIAVNHHLLWNYRTEMQAAADAASNAAAETIVGDDLLRGNPALMPALLDQARDAAGEFAARNRVQGRPFALVPNPDNDPAGDVVFYTMDTPRSPTLVLPGDTNDPTNAALTAINAVRVVARRTRERGNAPGLIFGQFTGVVRADVRAASTSMLDRDVIGLRPATSRPLPLAPLALFTDGGTDSRSWASQIDGGQAPDAYRFDRATQTFVADASGDGLREFPATLATDPSLVGTTNVALLSLGVTDTTGRADQIVNGVTADQLADFGGQLVLKAADNRLTVPGTELGPGVGSTDLMKLYQALDALRRSAEPRIFPLYCGAEGGTGNPILCGFVAGRVVTVALPAAAGQPLPFRVQPTMISTASAVTDASRRGVGGVAIVNPYICKVRYVE